MAILSRPDLMDKTVYLRLVEDPHVSEITKNNLINACSGLEAEEDVASAYDTFAGAHRRTGTGGVTLNDGEFVGHLKNLSRTAQFLADRLSMTREDVERHLKSLAGAGTVTERDEAKQWLDDEVASATPTFHISADPCWLFREGGARDARLSLSDAQNQCLPIRLGLPELLPAPETKGIEYLGYAVDASKLGPCTLPTFLDGSYTSVRDIWIVGGQSQPLPSGADACKAQGGLEEFLSAPPAVAEVDVFYSLVSA